MESLEIFYINQLLIGLKRGKSVDYVENSFKENFAKKYQKIEALRQDQSTSVLYELELILSRGRKGYPVLKSLTYLRARASEKYLIELDRFIQKAPFLSLIPLFLCFFPALILVFLGPFLFKLMEEVGF